MSQVPAISNETAISPEKTGTNSSGSNAEIFDRILEEEKRKLLSPLSIPQFQSLSLSNVNSDAKMDESVGKIESKAEAGNETKKTVQQMNQPTHIEAEKAEKTNGKTSAVEASKIEKANENRFTSNAVNKLFVGQIELDQDFYDNLKIANDSVSSLKGIDLSDLVSQIQDKIKFMKDKGNIELSIQLKPDGMGSILMDITNKNGVLSVVIYADKLAKQSLDESINELEKSLKEANLNIGSVHVFSDGQRKNNRGDNSSELMYNYPQES